VVGVSQHWGGNQVDLAKRFVAGLLGDVGIEALECLAETPGQDHLVVALELRSRLLGCNGGPVDNVIPELT